MKLSIEEARAVLAGPHAPLEARGIAVAALDALESLLAEASKKNIGGKVDYSRPEIARAWGRMSDAKIAALILETQGVSVTRESVRCFRVKRGIEPGGEWTRPKGVNWDEVFGGGGPHELSDAELADLHDVEPCVVSAARRRRGVPRGGRRRR